MIGWKLNERSLTRRGLETEEDLDLVDFGTGRFDAGEPRRGAGCGSSFLTKVQFTPWSSDLKSP